MTTLDEIAIKHGSDKASVGHNYTRVYEPLFEPLRDQPVGLLELGVWRGASLYTWADYFTHPGARIVGIDNAPGALYVPDRVEKYYSDQTEIPPELQGWFPDIVIDDASHLSSKTISSFKTWFPLLNKDGVYIVEDAHTSYDPDWAGHHEANENPDEPPRANRKGQTAMQFLRRLADEVQSFALKPEHRLGYDIESVCFHPNLVVVRKQAEQPLCEWCGGQADHKTLHSRYLTNVLHSGRTYSRDAPGL